jgi:aspartate-semialdehyde dehydrogenase
MVGSVLLQRMQAERDFEHIEPEFFSTSNVGGRAGRRQAHGAAEARLDIAALKTQDTIVTCQGGDYTNEVFPQLRAAGWNGYWIDAASALRMKDDAVIILDPVNREVIDAALKAGVKNYIGGNCTVSLMMMAVAGCCARTSSSGSLA